VREAGALAAGYFGGPLKVHEKGPGDPVSEADLAVNALLQRRLGEARPDYGWLSEESEDDPARLGDAPLFIVDPIDGTKTFIRGVPDFAVCVALIRGGRPLTAAVFNPATDEFFEAHLGGGARLNGDPIAVSAQGSLAGARLLASPRELRAGHSPDAFADARVSNRGSIAYKLALAACGRYDGVISMTEKSDWDIAAAELIVSEAGGRATTAAGGCFRYNRISVRHPSVIAAGPALHRELIGHLDPGRRTTT
jgi:myo-inositol-1(or 4)-monophosphatase